MPSVPQQVTPSSNVFLNAIQWGGWSWTDGGGPGTNITYFIAPGLIDITPVFGFGGFSFDWLPHEIAAYQAALQTWANVANITFTQVFTYEEADLVEFIYGEGGILGVHETPEGAFLSDGTAWGAYNFLGAGFTEAGLQLGGFGFITIVHELGHALGLAHPHDTAGGSGIFPGVTTEFGDFGDNDLNQGIFTTMSYNDGWTTGIGLSPSDNFGWQAGPMAFDIAAIQYLYGENTTYNTGNDLYLIGVSDWIACIWDAGGTDTIAYQGTFAVTINLNAATLLNAPGGGGFVSYANGAPTTSNDHWSAFTIANGVVIENATGDSGNDTIHLTSQNVNNLIDGNGGSDTVWVTYNFGSGYTVQAGSTASNLVMLGGAGADTLLDFEFVHFANGTTVTTASLIGTPPADDVRNDFNDDGRSDVLFQHTNGQLYQYQMDGLSVTGAGFVGSNSDPNWQVVAAGDFNGNGTSDILFQNTNGQLYQYQMNGLSVTGAGFVGSNSDPNWQVAAAGDFNGDGRSDILFQNTNGQLYQYQMDGLSVAGAGFVGSNSDPNWQVVAAGDFNGNGTSDILFQNTNGQLYQYQMNGLSVTGAGFVGSNSDPNWQVVAAGDFNGDGSSDILFQHTNGQLYQWQIDGLSVTGAGFVGNNSDPNWQVVAAGDFNGDGRSDILFQHTNGQLYEWQMNGFSVTGAGFVGSNADPGWQIAL